MAGSAATSGSHGDDTFAVAAVDVALGAAGAAWGALGRMTRPLALAAGWLPVGRLLGPPLRPVAERGRRLRGTAVAAAGRRLDVLLPAAVEAALARVDLTDLVHRHVDLDRLAATMDVDAIAQRLDLIGLANYVIDGVDLPEIIRQSSVSFTADAVRGVRLQGIQADQAISRAVDRLLPRRRPHDHPAPDGHDTG